MEPSRLAVQIVEIDEETAGQRVDNFLSRELKGVPRSRIYRLLRRGEVRVNGGRVKPSTRLQTGDKLRLPPVRMATPRKAGAAPRWIEETVRNSIIYEDPRMYVVNKPAGIAVHGGSGISQGLIEVMRKLYPDEKSLELVHRLDRDTSGCLMVARRRSALRELQRALRDRQDLHKYYLAVVHGRWPKRKTRVALPLAKNLLQSGERISRVAAEGKPSLTHFEVLATNGEFSLLLAEPVTGRTHQIRVHCAQSGHPVVGDSKYGDLEKNKAARKLGYRRMMLHAWRLEIPVEDGSVKVEAVLDESFSKIKKYIENNMI